MFAIIKNNQLIGFTDYKPTQKNMSFDKIIEGDFEVNKNYKYEDGVLIDITPIIESKELTKEEKIIQLENELKIILTDIKGAEELIKYGLQANGDEEKFAELQTRANELATERKNLIEC